MIYNCKNFIYVPVESDVTDQKVAKVSKYLGTLRLKSEYEVFLLEL